MKNLRYLSSISKTYGMTNGIVWLVIGIIFAVIALTCVIWVTVKRRPLNELGKSMKRGVWGFFDNIYEFFNYNNEVKTVYSDKAMNYSGTEFLPIPTKAPTQQYTYEFVGWDKNSLDEKGNVVIRAIYLQKVARCFVYAYNDDKKTLLKSIDVEYGAGADLSDIKPAKPETNEFSYEFVGWDKDTSSVVRNINVFAVYNAIPKKYTYRFLDEDCETLLSQGTAIYGTPIIAPNAPKKDGFKFKGWKNFKNGMLLTQNYTFICDYVKDDGSLSLEKSAKINDNQSQNIEILSGNGDNFRIFDQKGLVVSNEQNNTQSIKVDVSKTINIKEDDKDNPNIIVKKPGLVIEKNTSYKIEIENNNKAKNGDILGRIFDLLALGKENSQAKNSKPKKVETKKKSIPLEENILHNFMLVNKAGKKSGK